MDTTEQVKQETKKAAREAKPWVIWLSRFGYVATGVVYIILGFLAVQAALQYDPQEAGGLREALLTLAQQPLGPWLLGIVAVGLVAYGFYALALAQYRRVYF